MTEAHRSPLDQLLRPDSRYPQLGPAIWPTEAALRLGAAACKG